VYRKAISPGIVIRTASCVSHVDTALLWTLDYINTGMRSMISAALV
jgi:hypothetical protein